MKDAGTGAVFAQTNDAAANEVVAFARGDDGTLERIAAFATGGKGTGTAHLASQGSVVLADGGRLLLVANAGSADVSVFRIDSDRLTLVDRQGSAGAMPTSIAVHDRLVYVLNAGAPAGVVGFTIGDGGALTRLPGGVRELGAGSDPAQASFSPDGKALVVTDRGTDGIAVLAIGADGIAGEPMAQPAAGQTPYGFDFTSAGLLVVTEAFGGAIGAAAASSYTLALGAGLTVRSGSVGDTRSEVCWAVVTNDDRFAYVTNFGDGTISSYAIGADGSIELREPVAATTNLGVKGVRDEALTADGRYLYALDADAGKIFGFRVEADGRLSPVGEAAGMPATVAGLAAF
jgi:6-phosphogluconolactonase